MSTVTAIAFIVLAGCAVAFLWGAWVLVCNERTYKQRMRLIDWAGHDWWPRHSIIDGVEYRDHCWALLLLRDPAQLYTALPGAPDHDQMQGILAGRVLA